MMKAWLISIASVSILAAIGNMLLPFNSISKYARLCMSLLLTMTIIRPIGDIDINNVTIDIPTADNFEFKESVNLVDKEFSARFTEALIQDTGVDTLSLSAQLGQDSIISVNITGVQPSQQEYVNNILSDKYKIPLEIITYGKV